MTVSTGAHSTHTPDPRLTQVRDVTRTRWADFLFGLSLFSAYQTGLGQDAPLFFLETVAGDEIGQPGMQATVAIINIPDHDIVNAQERILLERRGWFQGGTWQYRLLLMPSGY